MNLISFFSNNFDALITVLVLIFTFQSLSKADDISDFEIDGISIGDSAYKYVANAIPAGMLHTIYSTIIHDLDFLNYGGAPSKETKKANHFFCHFAAATQKSLYNEFAAMAKNLVDSEQ